MRDESARSDTGFNNLPDLGALNNRPTPQFDDWNAGTEDSARPPLTNTKRFVPPPPNIQGQPNPTAETGTVMTVETMAALRKCLPNLDHMTDNVFRSFSPATLIQLNNSSAASNTNTDLNSSAAMAAAAAAHFAQSAQTAQKNMDPAIKMARALETLQKNPVDVAAGKDDRVTILHVARFMPGQ